MCHCISDVTVGFESTVYSVVEGRRPLDVCVDMKNTPDSGLVVDFAFDTLFSTSDGNAGI